MQWPKLTMHQRQPAIVLLSYLPAIETVRRQVSVYSLLRPIFLIRPRGRRHAAAGAPLQNCSGTHTEYTRNARL